MRNNKQIITIDDVLTINNINEAWLEVRRTCKNIKGKFNFSFYHNINIENIYRSLKDGSYKPLPYRLFLIYEPKPRLVMSQCVNDKIVSHFLTKNVLIPNLEKKLCDQNIATRKNKGGKYGNELIIKYINTLRQTGEVYCLKLDIRKYFYNINHDILIEKLIKDQIDQKTIDIVKKLVSETNKSYVNKYIDKIKKKFNYDIPYYNYNTGLGIGAVINQFLAIYYINDVIKYAKETLHCKYVVCYMDDLLILSNAKSFLKSIRPLLELEIHKLKLEVNPKSTIVSLNQGINFLGIRHYSKNGKYIRGFRKSTIKKINNRLKFLYKNNYVKYLKSLASYHGYFNFINNEEKGVYKMKCLDSYNYYKEKEKEAIVFVKEGSFYKSYQNDAIIIWYLFNYSLINDYISFGSKAYQKVFDELNRLRISYIIIDEDERRILFDNNNYIVYDKLANENFLYENRTKDLIEKLRKIVNLDSKMMDEIDTYLNKLLNNQS